MKEEIFRDLGFSEGEIKVYFALLKIQEATIGVISQKANVTPAKTYLILDKLIVKGLVSYCLKNNVKHFQVLNPEKLLNLIDEKSEELKEKREEVSKLIPDLKLNQDNSKQFARVYEGYEGTKTLYDEAINYCQINKEDFLAFSMSDKDFESESLKYFFSKYDKLRCELQINTRIIAKESQKRYLNSRGAIEFRFIDFNLPTGLIIFGDNVAYLSWGKNPVAFVITSPEIAKSNKQFFEDMWKVAKK